MLFSVQDALGVPSTKVPISFASFMSYVIPPVVCYIITAFLAVSPKGRALQLALWPIVAGLALRAALSVDSSLGNLEYKPADVPLVLFMITITFHSLCFTLARKPLVRHLRPVDGPTSTIMDALDLAINLRGLGWKWSRGLYIPPETRPANRAGFIFHTLLSVVVRGFICDLFQEATKTFMRDFALASQEPAIFDESLPLFARYVRAGIVTTLTGVAIHLGIEMAYNVVAVAGILLLGQDPAQWPPIMKNPWGATSLIEFWGRRWHQMYRQIFLVGAYPFSAVFGSAGTIVGAFLTSAWIHHLLLILLGSRPPVWKMLVGFGMMAPVVLAERGFYRLTGRKVGGVVGWMWTVSWLLLLGSFIIDGFLGARMFMLPMPAGRQWAVRVWVRKLVIDFDAWLHTI